SGVDLITALEKATDHGLEKMSAPQNKETTKKSSTRKTTSSATARPTVADKTTDAAFRK
ncbi:hypothetical protein HDU96_000644, partial [Phlyctochytrium bullatum]